MSKDDELIREDVQRAIVEAFGLQTAPTETETNAGRSSPVIVPEWDNLKPPSRK